MWTRVWPPIRWHNTFKIFRTPDARAAYSNLPSPSSLTWPTPSSSPQCIFALLCTTWTVHELHPDSSGLSVQVYSHSPITILGPSGWIRLTFTLCHRPPCRIVRLHITSRVKRYIKSTQHYQLLIWGPHVSDKNSSAAFRGRQRCPPSLHMKQCSQAAVVLCPNLQGGGYHSYMCPCMIVSTA